MYRTKPRRTIRDPFYRCHLCAFKTKWRPEYVGHLLVHEREAKKTADAP
jgi:hypothetical protein